ncbi:MAG TPA: hypothetical protein VNG51_21300 [Ktedonobacteraceae bacterium]|nr:hypothetical protein [Ktedonobacteraceae bacterium]
MLKNYDSLLIFPKGSFAAGLVMAFVPNFFGVYPISIHVIIIILGITYGIFGFTLLLIPWWLLKKHVIKGNKLSERRIWIGYILYTLITMSILLVLPVSWFTTTLVAFFSQVGANDVQWDASFEIFLAVLLGGYILSGFNLYWYIKEHKGF